jgi:hypothetical protein
VISLGTYRHTHQFSDITQCLPLIRKMPRLDRLLSNNTKNITSMRGAKKNSAQAEEEGEKKIKKRRLNNISRWLVDFWLTPPIQWHDVHVEKKKKSKEDGEERLETIYHSSDRSPLSAWWRWVSEQEVAMVEYLSSHLKIGNFVKQICFNGRVSMKTFEKPQFHELIISLQFALNFFLSCGIHFIISLISLLPLLPPCLIFFIIYYKWLSLSIFKCAILLPQSFIHRDMFLTLISSHWLLIHMLPSITATD